MGQLLRLNFENVDNTFKLLSALPNDRRVDELELLVNGEMKVLQRDGEKWKFKDNENFDSNRLADAIGKAITLRFRII
ncbi:hypothetical protein [Mucilaginibacter aquatilis]|uniref:Uncharacterized protein n=1 Tax=Mucilaginibacter aquatilis TaxID=1517760 RepID=A0A6I4IRI4_9SPHI|nr:hypothetical protein [Mucilaginibacter aquatilis]MVN92924.1 hypothetical protein [Mucilaginibacter aquatilis]